VKCLCRADSPKGFVWKSVPPGLLPRLSHSGLEGRSTARECSPSRSIGWPEHGRGTIHGGRNQSAESGKVVAPVDDKVSIFFRWEEQQEHVRCLHDHPRREKVDAVLSEHKVVGQIDAHVQAIAIPVE